jgi:hypothetical protein
MESESSVSETSGVNLERIYELNKPDSPWEVIVKFAGNIGRTERADCEVSE